MCEIDCMYFKFECIGVDYNAFFYILLFEYNLNVNMLNFC